MIQKTFMKYLALLMFVAFLMPSLGVAGMNDEDPSCCYKFAQNLVRGFALVASVQALVPQQTQGSYGIFRQSHFGKYEGIPRSYARYGRHCPVGFNPRDNVQHALGADLMEGISVCTHYGSDVLCAHPNRTLCEIYHPNLVRDKQREAGRACQKIAERSYSRRHDEILVISFRVSMSLFAK